MNKSNLLFIAFIIFVVFCFWLLEQKSITSSIYFLVPFGIILTLNGLVNLDKAIFKGYGDVSRHPFIGGANLFPETAMVKDSFRKTLLIIKGAFSLIIGAVLAGIPIYLK